LPKSFGELGRLTPIWHERGAEAMEIAPTQAPLSTTRFPRLTESQAISPAPSGKKGMQERGSLASVILSSCHPDRRAASLSPSWSKSDRYDAVAFRFMDECLTNLFAAMMRNEARDCDAVEKRLADLVKSASLKLETFLHRLSCLDFFRADGL
jgi:hypothetical protein